MSAYVPLELGTPVLGLVRGSLYIGSPSMSVAGATRALPESMQGLSNSAGSCRRRRRSWGSPNIAVRSGRIGHPAVVHRAGNGRPDVRIGEGHFPRAVGLHAELRAVGHDAVRRRDAAAGVAYMPMTLPSNVQFTTEAVEAGKVETTARSCR